MSVLDACVSEVCVRVRVCEGCGSLYVCTCVMSQCGERGRECGQNFRSFPAVERTSSCFQVGCQGNPGPSLPLDPHKVIRPTQARNTSLSMERSRPHRSISCDTATKSLRTFALNTKTSVPGIFCKFSTSCVLTHESNYAETSVSKPSLSSSSVHMHLLA